MMHSNKLVAALKANGKVLREFKDKVYVPFGSEYSILLKNLNSVRVVVNVQIDGTEACPGGLVIGPNSEVDLERFIKDGNLSTGNRFKFIERSASIEDYRGIKAEDGLIRVSFRYEKPKQEYQLPPLFQSPNSWPGHYPSGALGDVWCSTTVTNHVTKGITRGSVTASATNDMTIGTMSVGSAQSFVNEVGITVPGSISSQKFSTTTVGELEEQEHVIVLHILGEVGQKPIAAPVTVASKTKCTVCGYQNKRTAKFCSDCGASLTIV